MRRITPERIDPRVSVANLIGVKAGMFWGPRKIPDLELVLLLSGRLAHLRGGVEVKVEAGQVLLIMPGVEHRLEVLDSGRRTVMACIHFEPLSGEPYAGGRYSLEPEPMEVTDTFDDYIVRDHFTRCAGLFSGHSRYRDELLSATFRALWLYMCELWAGGSRQGISPRMNLLISGIRRNLARKFSRDALARELGVTPQYLNAIFRREVGLTPTDFINRERVYRASSLISSEGLSVKEAAARVGYRDQFYFSRVFKKVMKYPPSRSL